METLGVARGQWAAWAQRRCSGETRRPGRDWEQCQGENIPGRHYVGLPRESREGGGRGGSEVQRKSVS